jgi:hypothetical protein
LGRSLLVLQAESCFASIWLYHSPVDHILLR